MPVTFKFRGDQVGSLLRPPALLDARRRAETGEISTEELWEAENEAIEAAVKMQKEAGLDVFTDGEFRRADFRAGIVGAFDGITAKEFRMPWHGPDGMVKLPGTAYIVSGRLQQRRRITEGEAGFLRSVTSRTINMTMPTAGYFLAHIVSR